MVQGVHRAEGWELVVQMGRHLQLRIKAPLNMTPVL